MSFELEAAQELLERTPRTLHALLGGLSDAWASVNDGPNTWSPFDIVGHLIVGEQTDWIPRARIILEEGPTRPFDPFDRFKQQGDSVGQSLDDLLVRFERLRAQSLETLRGWHLTRAQLAKEGTHPVLGRVTLENLLATWTAHDVTHLAQIGRVLARSLGPYVGPWRRPDYMRILC